ALQEALHLREVFGVFWADQQMNIHEPRLRRDVEAQLDVREEQRHLRQSAGQLILEEFFVGVGDVVVGDSDRSDLRRHALKRREVGIPRVGSTELIVENSAWRMDV